MTESSSTIKILGFMVKLDLLPLFDSSEQSPFRAEVAMDIRVFRRQIGPKCSQTTTERLIRRLHLETLLWRFNQLGRFWRRVSVSRLVVLTDFIDDFQLRAELLVVPEAQVVA